MHAWLAKQSSPYVPPSSYFERNITGAGAYKGRGEAHVTGIQHTCTCKLNHFCQIFLQLAIKTKQIKHYGSVPYIRAGCVAVFILAI